MDAEKVLLLIIVEEVNDYLGPYASTKDRYNAALFRAHNIFLLYAHFLATEEGEDFREEGIVLCNQGPPLFLTAEWKFKIRLAVMTVEEPW